MNKALYTFHKQCNGFSEFTEGQTKIDHVLQRGARIYSSDHLRISRAGFCGLVYHFSTYSYQMSNTKLEGDQRFEIYQWSH